MSGTPGQRFFNSEAILLRKSQWGADRMGHDTMHDIYGYIIISVPHAPPRVVEMTLSILLLARPHAGFEKGSKRPASLRSHRDEVDTVGAGIARHWSSANVHYSSRFRTSCSLMPCSHIPTTFPVNTSSVRWASVPTPTTNLSACDVHVSSALSLCCLPRRSGTTASFPLQRNVAGGYRIG